MFRFLLTNNQKFRQSLIFTSFSFDHVFRTHSLWVCYMCVLWISSGLFLTSTNTLCYAIDVFSKIETVIFITSPPNAFFVFSLLSVILTTKLYLYILSYKQNAWILSFVLLEWMCVYVCNSDRDLDFSTCIYIYIFF